MAFINYAALAAIVLSNLPTSAMSALTFTSMTKEALVEKFVSQDGDVEFSNIKASLHYDKCTRYYTGGHSMGYAWLNDDNATLTDVHLIPDEGIMLSSGDPLDFESNDSDQETTRWYTSENKLFDEHLAATINNNAVFDACFVEFDFKCSGEGYVPQVSFKYMFGSEEYYEYVDSPYNDAFALLLNGVNIARLPSTESNTDVVSINNVNYHLNRQFFHGNDPGTGDLADPVHDDLGMIYPQMEPDGFTIILTAHGTPWQNPDQTNSIKIVVGDVGDGILDSWVLLESGTFSCVDITEAPSMSSQPSSAPTLKPSTSRPPSLAPSSFPTLSVAPTAAPSLAPTISQAPTHQPSASPSISKKPSAEPSSNPSSSVSPSANPSDAPSTSQAPSHQPSASPSVSTQPSAKPTSNPSLSTSPSANPTTAPSTSKAPTNQPSASPSISTEPSAEPSSNPSLSTSPSANPTSAPSTSQAPTHQPSASPSISTEPSAEPSSNPSLSTSPSANPSDSPSTSQAPTNQPSASPSISTQPSAEPTSNPSLSSEPSSEPSLSPTVSAQPTSKPSLSPSVSAQPTVSPSSVPSAAPSSDPTAIPSANPTTAPSTSKAPTNQPSASPSLSSEPSTEPTSNPSLSASPSANPSDSPSTSQAPSHQPSASPSISSQPSAEPSSNPSLSTSPSANPSDSPSSSQAPSQQPSASPSNSTQPSAEPSSNPSLSTSPSASPSDSPSTSQAPSHQPSASPSISTQPSAGPSSNPSLSSEPSSEPSLSPSVSAQPTVSPSSVPSAAPSSDPTVMHSKEPSLNPTISSSPSVLPTSVPSLSTAPQGAPSILPTISMVPTSLPSVLPTLSSAPSSKPSFYPTISAMPSSVPSLAPSLSSSPSSSPSIEPSLSKEPTGGPTSSPSISTSPSSQPTLNPSASQQPSVEPSSEPSLSTSPSSSPSSQPSASPTQSPSASPSLTLSETPSTSKQPSAAPSSEPSLSSSPSSSPSSQPSTSTEPTQGPSSSPSTSTSPSSQPTAEPSTSKQPSAEPSSEPSLSSSPSSSPSIEPSISKEPTGGPTLSPTISTSPSSQPTAEPSTSKQPSAEPSSEPSLSSSPSSSPSIEPSISKEPTGGPTLSPTISTSPSSQPTAEPSTSKQPSDEPSTAPSLSTSPSSSPSLKPSSSPTQSPSASPSLTLSDKPSESSSPSAHPSNSPSLSMKPSSSPTTSPSKSSEPSSHPSLAPSASSKPSSEPTLAPSESSSPTSQPSSGPSTSGQPSSEPSLAPSSSAQPTSSPTDNTLMPSLSSKPSSSPTGRPSVSSLPSSAPTSMASVGPNTVFNDLDADGIQDENEPGLPSITVVLYNATDDTPVATTETDENGVYVFSELAPGSFYATVFNVTYYFSPVQEGGNQATANEDGPNGNTPTVELSAGEVIDNWNVGLYEPVTVGNRVWLDYNADGAHDDDEPGLGNITVILVDQSGTPVEGQVQVSDPEGYYLFSGLPPGVYGVEFVVPADYKFSPPNPLSDSIDRSDPNAGDYAADIDSSGMAAPAELQSGSADLTFDAGIYAPVDIGGTIFLDLDADGIRDSGEADGVEGVTLILYDTPNDVSVGEAVTSSDGTYVFPLMQPGTYHVKLLVPSEEYVVSPLAEGGNTFDSSHEPPMTASVRILSGFDAVSLFDGGLYQLARTSLYVWNDTNGDGIQDEGESPYTSDATVNIYDPSSSNPTTPIATGNVASDGTFTQDIAPGNYTVEVVLSDADALFSPQDQGSDDTADSDVDTNGVALITVVSGEQSNISAGVTAMPQVASCVFLDSNGNGLQDDGEPPLSDVEVELYHANGTLAAVTTSDETCFYGFVAPQIGDYFVTVTIPQDYVLSPVVVGGNQISSNEDGSNNSPVVTLTLGSVEDSWKVGMYVPVSIGNRVWNDLDGDGIQDGSEPGIEDIVVSLNDQDGVEVATTETDNTGHYLFEGLSPGNYSVVFQLPDGYAFTIPAKTTADIVDPVDGSYAYDDVTSDADRDTGATPVVMLLSGSSNLSLDAGMFIPVSINGTTWHDLNADGFHDEGEPILEGSTIILYDVDGDVVIGTSAIVVGPSGFWAIDDLPPGTYTGQIQPPSGEWYLSPIPEDVGNGTSTNFDPADSKTSPVFLQSGESGGGYFDAGFYMAASVGDRVWFDEEPNGVQDFGEPPMNTSVAVRLYDSLGYLKGETETSAGGYYQFTDLRPGTYEVEFILPSEDFNFAIFKAGENDALDSDANPKTGRAEVTLQSGEINDDIDAGIMDASPYYPDWTNDVQVCTNDGFDPAWLEGQKVNYLYSNKEACCRQHFWWRMTQCMANEEFKFYQKEDKCDTKVVFEDWESNTPDMFHGGESTLFDTLDECCAHKFWYDFDGCMGRSPVIYKFEFCVDIGGLVDPLDCQSADIYGTVLEAAINVNADLGFEVDASVTKIGDASLTKVTGSTVCGGSLEGQDFTNDLTGSNPDIDGAVGTTTEVCGFLTVEAGNDCKDEDCLMTQYQDVAQALTEATTTGSLTDTVKEKAITRLPPVPELQDVIAANFTYFDVLMPGTITGDFDTKFFFGTDLTTCQEKPTITFRDGDARYDTLHLCCQQHFVWDISGCCSNGGGCPELPDDPVVDDPGVDELDGYYPTWAAGELCAYKSGFESWEERFDTIEDCCTSKFSYDYDNCVNPTSTR